MPWEQVNSGFSWLSPKLMRELLLGTLEDQPWIEIVEKSPMNSEIVDHVHRTVANL